MADDPKFMNPKYPVLSFLYAVYAGGEAGLFTADAKRFMEVYGLPEEARSIVLSVNDDPDSKPTAEHTNQLLQLVAKEILATQDRVW